MADLYFLVCGVAALYIGLSETSRQNKPLWMSCKYTWNGRAVNSVDGNHDTCFILTPCIGSSSEFVVDLMTLYHIENISIYTKRTGAPNFPASVVQVYERNPTRCQMATGTFCGNYTGRRDSFETISCDRQVVGRYVRLMTHRGSLRMCKIKVYGIQHAIQTSNFIRVPGGSLRSFYPSVKSSALSRVSCVQQCKLSGTCVGVRYNRGSRECQLLTPLYEPIHTANPNWVYYEDGRQTYC